MALQEELEGVLVRQFKPDATEIQRDEIVFTEAEQKMLGYFDRHPERKVFPAELGVQLGAGYRDGEKDEIVGTFLSRLREHEVGKRLRTEESAKGTRYWLDAIGVSEETAPVSAGQKQTEGPVQVEVDLGMFSVSERTMLEHLVLRKGSPVPASELKALLPETMQRNSRNSTACQFLAKLRKTAVGEHLQAERFGSEKRYILGAAVEVVLIPVIPKQRTKRQLEGDLWEQEAEALEKVVVLHESRAERQRKKEPSREPARTVKDPTYQPRRSLANGSLVRVTPDTSDDPLAWQSEGLCAQTDPEAFFPEKGGSTREAKKICSGCEVKAECLGYALDNDERFGIWGGLSERERRRLKRTTA